MRHVPDAAHLIGLVGALGPRLRFLSGLRVVARLLVVRGWLFASRLLLVFPGLLIVGLPRRRFALVALLLTIPLFLLTLARLITTLARGT